MKTQWCNKQRSMIRGAYQLPLPGLKSLVNAMRSPWAVAIALGGIRKCL